MSSFAVAVLLMATLATDPVALEVDRGAEALVIRFELLSEMPESVVSGMSSGARVEIDYPLRVYARRRLFPDRKVWKGPLHGHFRRHHRAVPVPTHCQRLDHGQSRGRFGRGRQAMVNGATRR